MNLTATHESRLEAKPPSRFVERDGRRIHYHDLGSGEPVLMVHGVGPGAFGWGTYFRTAPTLARRYRIIIPDLPGFGESTRLPDVSDPLAAYAEAIRALIEELGIPQSHFIGISMGGGTCLRIAIDHPEMVRRLVVLATIGFEPAFITPEPTPGVAMLTRYYADPSVEGLRRLAETLVFDEAKVSEELVRKRHESAMAPANVEAAIDLYHALRQPDVRRRMDLGGEIYKISAPTLMIWGRDDRFVPLDAALGLLQRLPDGRLYVISKCGHSVPLEFPEEFLWAVAGFLERT